MEISDIKSRLSITDVLTHYGIKSDRNNRVKCPWHDDKTPSLKIYPSTNTNSFVVYYLDTADSKLKKASTSATTPVTVAEYLTNTVLFTSESYNGTILTDNQNNRVIGVDMQFYQIRYPITTIGAGGYFDYYQVKTKITRRALE